MPSHFKVKEYCPCVFRNLRERFCIEEVEFLKSLTRHEPEYTDSPSRSSSSRCFMSYDSRFLIKTLSAEEVAEVHAVLQEYHKFVVEKHGRTLLPQFLGMFRVTVEGTETYLLVTRNILGKKYPIHKKYDLKGSTVQRMASEKEKAKELPTYKDNDFLDDGVRLNLPEDAKTKLMDMMTADCEFLAKLHLMDYSLLVGIHDVDTATVEAQQQAKEVAEEQDVLGSSPPAGDSTEPDEASLGSGDLVPVTPPDSPLPSEGAFAPLSPDEQQDYELRGEFYAIPSRPDVAKREIYYIALVDILTYYGVKKRTASAAKSVKYGSEAENISTVKPDQYAKRLCEFVRRAIS